MAYDLETLRRGRESILANIEAMEKALESERQKLGSYEREIAVAEALLKLHKVCKTASGEHDWEHLAVAPDGSWRRRRCRFCRTEERLGDEP